jgi:hypothetical protein
VHKEGTAWVEDCFEPASGNTEGVIFGWGVASDGERFVVTAPGDPSAIAGDPTNDSMRAAGAAYVFTPEQVGAKRQYLKEPHPRIGAFGFSLALGGGRLAIGAAYEPDPSMDAGPATLIFAAQHPSGAVYVFPLN